MESQQRLVFFGDQTVDALTHLREIVRQSTKIPSLKRFLRDSADIVQALLPELKPEERQPYIRFDTILELSEIHSSRQFPCEPIGTVLWFIAQFGHLIACAEEDPSILLEIPREPTYIIPLCTGSLSAAAGLAARNVHDLLRIGKTIVSVAFRLGLALWRRSHGIESLPGRWAVAIANVAPAEIRRIITAFNEARAIPKHRQVYISFSSHTRATISGPPSIFPELWSYSETLSLARKVELNLGFAAHAAHLLPLDTNTILGESDVYGLTIAQQTRIISASTCKPLESKNLGHLLRNFIDEIAQQTLDFAGIIDYCVSNLNKEIPIQVTQLGPPSQIGKSFLKALQDGGLTVNSQEFVSTDSHSGPREGSNLIAIVGQSARFPGSEDIESFWTTIRDKIQTVEKIPRSRFDLATHYDPTGAAKSTVTTPYGSFLENPGLFDNRLFNISPREAKQMDPVQRILLMCSYEALQMSGYSPDASPSTNRMRVATFFGQTTDDWRDNDSQDIDIYFVPGTIRAFTPGKLNYHYKWGGANYSVDSACASSTTSVIMACNSLLARECDTALAGGGQMHTSSATYAGLSRAGFLSKTPGGCKTFRDDADGYCRGEGVGVVVLKRLEDALADNDNVLAVIRGGNKNYSWDSTSITHPSAAAQIKLVQDVLRNTGTDPNEIGYVEMHGTGTQAGDAVEMAGISTVFGKRERNNPLYVGGVKANIGHGEAAAGIASLIKSIEILRRGMIPPQAGFPGPRNHKFDYLDDMNIQIPESLIPFTSQSAGGKNMILINNFDASGGNNTLLIQSGEQPAERIGQDPRTHHVVTVSARTTASLQKNLERLLTYLENNPDTRLDDVAYSTTARRIHEDLRKAYAVESISELKEQLKADIQKDMNMTSVTQAPTMVFTFTGQGSHYSGMGKELFATCAQFHNRVMELDSLCQWHGFASCVEPIASGDFDYLQSSPTQVQLAIAVLEMALADLWKTWGAEPSLVIGYSLGEYAALYVAGVLSAQDVVFLVGSRAKLIEKKCVLGSHVMLALQVSAEDAVDLLKSYPGCEVSCKGAPQSTVVGGPVDAITNLQDQMAQQSQKTIRLDVPYSFHSPQVDVILEEFEAIAQRVHFNNPRIPVASTLLGSIIKDQGVFSPQYLRNQARQPVDFVGALRACENQGLVNEKTIWLECGPKPVLTNLVRSTLNVSRNQLLYALSDKEQNWKTVATSATLAYKAGVPFKWPVFHREHTPCLRLLELPTYAFDLKEFWIRNDTIPGPPKALEPTKAPVDPPKPIVPGFPTVSLQEVVSESINASGGEVTFESLLSNPTLLAVIDGHLIDGVPLCPASLFIDMAFGAAKYMHYRVKPGTTPPQMSVLDMSITHPLVPSSNKDSRQRIVVKAKMSSSSMVEIEFGSREGEASHTHGSCKVRFDNRKEWESSWSQTAYFIKAFKDNVIKGCHTGTGHRLLQSVAYKLFANIVIYSEPFQTMKEIYVPADFSTDVAATLTLPSPTEEFTLSPYRADCLIHLPGFLLNGKPEIKTEECYIASGFQEFRVLDDLEEGKAYSAFAHINEIDKQGNVLCEAYLFDGDKIVGTCKGISFQRMSRRALKFILGGANNRGHSQTNHAPVDRKARSAVVGAPIHLKREDTVLVSATRAVDQKPTHNIVSLNSGEEVIEVIISKTGFDPADVQPSTAIADMGLDSLMTIEVIGELKSSRGIELPTDFFNHHLTIEDVRQALNSEEMTSDDEMVTGIQTPKSESTALTDVSVEECRNEGEAEAVLDIIFNLTGFDAADVQPSTNFADMGLDSLLTIEVVGVVNERIGLELPTDFFVQNPTVSDVRKALGCDVALPATSIVPVEKKKTQVAMKPLSHYQSNVVLLQGNSKSKKIPLFLIADGSGSATSYMYFSRLFPDDTPVYACESPFFRCPEELQCTIEESSSLYFQAIRKKRPHGPYMIGGWSLGSAYTFEVCKMLADAGETVDGMFVLDFKISVQKHSKDQMEPTMEMFDMMGIAKGIKIPSRNINIDPMTPNAKLHCFNSIRSVAKWTPKPMTPQQRPKHVYSIWAGQGLEDLIGGMPQGITDLLKREEEVAAGREKTRAFTMLLWFFGKRQKDIGPDGWDEATGGPVTCVTLPCDHFTMVNKPYVDMTSEHLKRLIAECVRSVGSN